MIKQLIINGKKSYDDFDLYISDRKISQPKKKSIKESVPFSNVVYDFSKINGEIYWEERTLQYVFDFAELSTEEVEVAKSKALTWLMNVHDTDIYDPYIGDYHFHGSFESDSWDEDFGAGTLTINFSVYPYKIGNNDTSVIEEIGDELTGSSPLTINNSASDDLENLTIYGNSEQETTEGYNLYDNNFSRGFYGITASGVINGNEIKITITEVTGTTSWGFYLSLKNYIANLGIADGESVLIKYKIKTTNTNSFPQYFGDWEAGKNRVYSPSTNQTLTEWTERYILANYNASSNNGALVFYSDKIAVGDIFYLKDVMICRSSTDKPYEKYTGGIASPNPNYPSEIKNICGVENLLDFDTEVSFKPSLNYAQVGKNTNPFTKGAGFYSFKCTGTITSSYKIWAYDSNNNLIVNIESGQYVELTEEKANSIVKVAIVFQELTPNIQCNGYVYPMIVKGKEVPNFYVPYGSKYLKVDTFSGNYLDKINNYGWIQNDATFEVIDDYLKIIMPLSIKRWSGVYCKNYGDDGLSMVNLLARLKGKRCTYSFYARADKERTIYFQFGDTEVTYINLTTEWKRYSRTMVIGSQVPTFYCGETYDDTTFYIKDIMLEDGDTLNDYRENGEDYILIDMKKPNLVDFSTHQATTDTGGEGGSITFEGEGYIVDATDINSANGRGDWFSIPLIVGHKYKLSFESDEPFVNVRMFKVDKSSTYFSSSETKGEFEFIATENLGYFRTWTKGGTTRTLKYVKLYEGEESYFELCEINGTKDELFLDKSTKKIIQRIGKVVLDGSENWTPHNNWNNSNSDMYHAYILLNGFSSRNILIDKFKIISVWQNNLSLECCYMDGTNALYLFVNSSRLSEFSIDGFKKWLSENPVTVYYVLATPVEINNEPITLPKSFDDGTIITINDELEVTMNVTYNEKKTLIIDNVSSHRVTPSIMVEGDLTIELNNTSYGLSTGTYNNGLYLESGINELIIRGTGKIKFSYVEEVL